MNSEIQSALESAPSPDPAPADLKGWESGTDFVCVICAGRLIKRGCGHLLRGWSPIWGGKRNGCGYCGGQR